MIPKKIAGGTLPLLANQRLNGTWSGIFLMIPEINSSVPTQEVIWETGAGTCI